MKIGICGLGKLGLPVALAIESKGHKVVGYDINPDIASYLRTKNIPFKEKYVNDLLKTSELELVSMKELADCDLIFIAIQTPHDSLYEGVTRLPDTRADFDYNYLIRAVRQLVYASEGKELVISIISTVLPGTIKREIKPILPDNIHLIYNPFFIAMGTVIDDFLDPEFVLLGRDSDKAEQTITKFYKTLHNKPLFLTDLNTAEGIKVFYNTFITMKTVLANMYGEMADKLGMQVDDIYKALTLATDRIISPKYLKAGMGDGGGCHPRDNIALSYIADKVGLSFNIFDSLMLAREKHTEWLADLCIKYSQEAKLPLIILGKSFKPETNIQTGSPAILLANILKEKGIKFDHIAEDEQLPDKKAVYFIATQHKKYLKLKPAKGSVIIDPFGYIDTITDKDGVYLYKIGR